MGARDLLADLAAAGVNVTAEGDRLMIRPASKLTDDMRAALRMAKPEVLALLAGNTAARPYRLSRVEADRCHVRPWDEATCALFVARVGTLMRQGIGATDADDLAERLLLRDRDGDDRRLCHECSNYRRGVCERYKQAGVGRELGVLATLLQRCRAFAEADS